MNYIVIFPFISLINDDMVLYFAYLILLLKGSYNFQLELVAISI